MPAVHALDIPIRHGIQEDNKRRSLTRRILRGVDGGVHWNTMQQSKVTKKTVAQQHDIV